MELCYWRRIVDACVLEPGGRQMDRLAVGRAMICSAEDSAAVREAFASWNHLQAHATYLKLPPERDMKSRLFLPGRESIVNRWRRTCCSSLSYRLRWRLLPSCEPENHRFHLSCSGCQLVFAQIAEATPTSSDQVSRIATTFNGAA